MNTIHTSKSSFACLKSAYENIEYLLIWHLRKEKLIEILNFLILEVVSNV